MSACDAIVLGADVEGLTAAAFLARAGLRVVVVEEGADAGGLSARAEVHPGHSVPGTSHDPHLARRSVLAALELEAHGLAWRPRAATVVAGDGRVIALPRDGTGAGLDGDAGAYARWHAFLAKVAPVVDGVLADAPPQAIEPGWGELARLARTGLKLRKLGQHDLFELVRIVPMSAADWMGEHFTDPLLAAGLVAPALSATVFGPRAPGTAGLALLAHCAGTGEEPVGGSAGLVDALLACCRASGVELRCGAAPRRIVLERGRAAGVELADGARVDAPLVASALDPRRTLLDLIVAGSLAPAAEDAVATFRARGTTALVRLALSRPLPLLGDAERLLVVSSLDHLERCADGIKHGRLPEAPWLDVRAWSRSAPGSAPPGKETVSIQVNGIPAAPADGRSDEQRAALLEAVLDALEHALEGTRDAVLAHELLMPSDVEARHGTTGGHLHHGELALDQLWLQRPSLALGRYATPVPGLFLCGSGSHPGGPYAGGAGALGARALLASVRG